MLVRLPPKATVGSEPGEPEYRAAVQGVWEVRVRRPDTVAEGGEVSVRWLKLSIPLLLAIGITGWLILDTRLSALEERIAANRSAELHLEQAQDIERITNDLSGWIRRVEER